MAGCTWKQPKVLGMLDQGVMRKSCISFPQNLPLDPHAEVEEYPDTAVYDPGFILPFLIQLLSQEMYMAKYMRLVDSGALSFAISFFCPAGNGWCMLLAITLFPGWTLPSWRRRSGMA